MRDATAQSYLCTRPKLASLLIGAGAEVTKTTNPFADTSRHDQAWYVSLDDSSARIIADYFTAIGKPTPATVTAYMKGRCSR